MGGDWGSETEPGRVRIPAGPARGTDREISASFEQEKSATEVGQSTPVG